MRAEVKLDLRHLSIAELMTCAQSVDLGLTGNPRFPDAGALLTELQACTTAAQQAIDDYEQEKNALQMKLRVRNAAVQSLGTILRTTACYVDSASGGEAQAAMSSGFPLRREPAPLGEPAQVEDLRACANAGEGCLRLAWKPVHGVCGYEVQIGTSMLDSGSWTTCMVATQCRGKLTKLTSGSKVWVRVRAVGGKSLAGQWSGAVGMTVP